MLCYKTLKNLQRSGTVPVQSRGAEYGKNCPVKVTCEAAKHIDVLISNTLPQLREHNKLTTLNLIGNTLLRNLVDFAARYPNICIDCFTALLRITCEYFHHDVQRNLNLRAADIKQGKQARLHQLLALDSRYGSSRLHYK